MMNIGKNAVIKEWDLLVALRQSPLISDWHSDNHPTIKGELNV